MKLKNFKPNDISQIAEEISNLYQITQLKLPSSFEKFYLKNNGGNFDTYIIKNNNESWIAFSLFEEYLRLYEFYSIDDIVEKYEYLREEAEIYVDIKNENFYLNHMLPISDVNSVDCICVCCQGEHIGKLYLIEWGVSQSQGILPLPQQLVASSFEELLEKMVLEEDDEDYQQLLKI